MANGACVEEIAAAGESRKFADITQRLKNVVYALGVAATQYGLCDGALCGNECLLGKPTGDCQRCAAAPDVEAFAACYFNPTGSPDLSAQLCTAAMECAHRTGCALTGLESCYGSSAGPSGPCGAELTAAGQGRTPADIVQQLQAASQTSTLGAVGNQLSTELAYCKPTCFSPSSGGSGGSGSRPGGAGGSSGAGGGTGG